MKTNRIGFAATLALMLAGTACTAGQNLGDHPDAGRGTSSGSTGAGGTGGEATTSTSSAAGGGATTSTSSGAGGGASSTSGGAGGSCSNACTDGATKCAGTQVQKCAVQSDGCTDWNPATDCPANETCSGTQCALDCADQCTSGATRCSGNGVETCAIQPSGCTDWGSAAACPLSCSAGSCTADACFPGQTSCAGALLSTCVLSNGTYGWGAGAACPAGQSCANGVCAFGPTTITQDTVLCGDLYYTGAFAIQGGAKVTCPSGQLSIHAPSISIDPASSIDISGTSSTPSGSAGGAYGPQNPQFVVSGSGGGYGNVGGDALRASYHLVGSPVYYICSTGAVDDPGTGGPASGSLFDLLIAMGGKGGDGGLSCMTTPLGGYGGGAVQLIGASQVNVLGKILANGAAGAAAPATCNYNFPNGAGGGSGGGVFMMAPSVQIGATAVLSATGGGGGDAPALYTSCGKLTGGAGGDGRIKILYGDTYDNQGTVTGSANSISWMPPVSISSSTHPSQTLWYNDGLSGDFSFSWAKPFPGAHAYYYRFDSNPSLQLTPSNGTATITPAATVPKTSVGGTYYFYVLTVDDNGLQASTVANRYKVQINSTKHNLSSTSHPDQNAWYQGALSTTLSMAWSLPGFPAGNFKGYYYRIDNTSRVASPDVSAPVIGWTYTTATSVVTQQDYQGNAVGNGTYYFHLVSVDSMGYPTVEVAAYRVQIGPQPAQTGFFGYVTSQQDGSSLAGVTVTLEPYGLSATTDPNGYFLFQNVYEETYTLTATKTGYTTVQETVGVTPGVSPYNFSM